MKKTLRLSKKPWRNPEWPLENPQEKPEEAQGDPEVDGTEGTEKIWVTLWSALIIKKKLQLQLLASFSLNLNIFNILHSFKSILLMYSHMITGAPFNTIFKLINCITLEFTGYTDTQIMCISCTYMYIIRVYWFYMRQTRATCFNQFILQNSPCAVNVLSIEPI